MVRNSPTYMHYSQLDQFVVIYIYIYILFLSKSKGYRQLTGEKKIGFFN